MRLLGVLLICSLESVPSLYGEARCHARCTHTLSRHQHQFPGQELHRNMTGRGSVWRGGGAWQSLARGAGQSETDAAMTPASTICAAPLQERLVPRASRLSTPIPAWSLNCWNQKGYNPHSRAASALPSYTVSCSNEEPSPVLLCS